MTTTAPAPGYYRLAREINNPSKPDRRRTAPLRGWKRSSVSAGELVRVEHRSETFQGNPITIVVAVLGDWNSCGPYGDDYPLGTIANNEYSPRPDVLARLISEALVPDPVGPQTVAELLEMHSTDPHAALAALRDHLGSKPFAALLSEALRAAEVP